MALFGKSWEIPRPNFDFFSLFFGKWPLFSKKVSFFSRGGRFGRFFSFFFHFFFEIFTKFRRRQIFSILRLFDTGFPGAPKHSETQKNTKKCSGGVQGTKKCPKRAIRRGGLGSLFLAYVERGSQIDKKSEKK